MSSRSIHTGIHKSIHTGIHKSIHKCIHTGIHKSPPLSPRNPYPPALTTSLVVAQSYHPSPSLSSPLSSPPLSSLPGPHHHVHCWSSCRAVVSSVPAILTSILTAILTPQAPMSCHAVPAHPHQNLTAILPAVLVVAQSCDPLSSPPSSPLSSTPRPHHQCWLSSPPGPQHLHLKRVTEGRLSEPGSLRRGRGLQRL